jgi:hypothetical protein
MRDFILRELEGVGLAHNTFTQPAVDLVVRSADGVLRAVRNLTSAWEAQPEAARQVVTTDRDDWGDNLSPAEFMRAFDIVSSRLRVAVNDVDHFYRFSGGDWEADTAEDLAEMIIGCWPQNAW